MMGDLQNLISRTRVKYDQINKIWCPILNSYVYFTSEGRVHLLYKSNRKKRPVQEQLYKLRLFPLVIPTIKTSNRIKSIRPDPKKENVKYYAIVGKVGRSKISVRVIIKQTSSGRFNYHSVMIDSK